MLRTYLTLSTCFATVLTAQEFRSSILGRVMDQQHAGIPGAKVVAMQVETGARTETVTGGDGIYTLAFLLPGSYSASAKSADSVTVTADTRLREAATASVAAFPGAEGAGMWTSGGRGGRVYRVTNLNATGPGSLADAVSGPNRFVVFTVSGVIDLNGRKIEIAHPNITVAGQTAPGEGVTIVHGALNVTAGNVILRHLRVRRGQIAKGDMGDAVGVKGDFENVMLDHLSAFWATDENLTLTNANNVTAQYCINAEALDYFNPPQTPPRHAFGSLFGSTFDDGRMTIHHSLYAHNRLRNARTTAGGRIPPVLDFRNNVVYDSKEATSHTGSQAVHCNWVNNYIKDGPSTGIEDHPEEVRGVVFGFHGKDKYRLYLSGNYVDGYQERTADNWQAVAFGRGGRALVRREDVYSATPFASPPVTTHSAQKAFETVLEEAGAILPSRDAVDLRVINDVRNGAGAVINTERDISEPGRWQTNHSLPAPADADADGMPDFWESQYGLRPADPGDAMKDADGDGYANIEEYVNNTDPSGGALPVVYVSASVSRAWRADGTPGEFRVWRTGPLEEELSVAYTAAGVAGKLTIPSGARYATVSIPPGEGEHVVLALAPSKTHRIGCPNQAVVVTADGRGPRPVNLRDVDPQGGETPEDRAWHERVMKEHVVKREGKIQKRNRNLADPNYQTKKPAKRNP